MKNTYLVKYKHGLVGDSIVFANDKFEAIKEAISFCRFRVMSIPENFKPADIIASITKVNNIDRSKYQYRPVVEINS